MQREPGLVCSRASWHDREAYVLENEILRLLTLTGGGHIAEFRFRQGAGDSSHNPLWVPPWKTIDPHKYRARIHQARYGPPITGKLLSGIVGHNICLDYFGPPSEEEAKRGLSIHGEAPSSRWGHVRTRTNNGFARLQLSTVLPVAGIRFSREIEIRRGEPVAYFTETVCNQRNADHFFHWTEHVTFGPPFLQPGKSRVFISGTRGRTFPHGYEGKALLKSSEDFRWPHAPGISGARVDLSQPFVRRGLGFVAAVLLDPRREIEFVAALNNGTRLLTGYCFRRDDFPWVTIWEENQARTDPPWNGRCQARGVEFGSTPFPVPRREAFSAGPLFGAPHCSVVPARGVKKACYISFLAQLPPGVNEVRNISVAEDALIIIGRNRHGRSESVRLPASGLSHLNLA